MHEFGMVDDFIHHLVDEWKDKEPNAAAVFRILYGPGLQEDALRQAFEVHTAGTPLERARFEFVPKPVTLSCACGTVIRPVLGEAEIPYTVCSSCDAVVPVPGFNVIELLMPSSRHDVSRDPSFT